MNGILRKLNVLAAILYMVIFTTPIFRYVLGDNFRFVGIGCLLLWVVTAFLINRPRYISRFLALVLGHLVLFVFMVVCDLGNVGSIIVGYVAFWSFSIIFEFYHEQGDEKAIRFITIVLLIVICITAVTTIFASIKYPNISKNTYTDDKTGEKLMNQLNVGGFDYIGGMSVLSPILMFLSIKKKQYFLLIPFALCVTNVVMSGYAIAFLVLVIGIIAYFIADSKGKISFYRILPIIILLGIMIVVLKNSDSLVGWIENSNEHLAGRLEEVQDILNGKLDKNSDLFARMEFYDMSLQTFLDNMITGVGPYYYGEGGLGNHSQILDDLGRYGLLAIGFYIAFVYTLKQWIEKIRQKTGKEFSMLIPYLLFALFSCVNPTLILPVLGMTIFFVLPGLYYI